MQLVIIVNIQHLLHCTWSSEWYQYGHYSNNTRGSDEDKFSWAHHEQFSIIKLIVEFVTDMSSYCTFVLNYHGNVDSASIEVSKYFRGAELK